MDEILCECSSCGVKIGTFFNHWARIGKGYVSPIIDIGADIAAVPHGLARPGESLTLVQGCQLQDIACAKCDTILGLKCIEVPVNHVLDENQVLLRLTAVRSVYAATGGPAELVVKRVLRLREPPGSSSVAGGQGQDPVSRESLHGQVPGGNMADAGGSAGLDEVVDLLQIRADLEGQREDIDRIDTTGFKIVSKLDGAVARIQTEVDRMNRSLDDLRGDLRGNQDDLASLKSDVRESRAAAASQQSSASAGLQSQIQSVRDIATGFKREMGEISTQLRRDLAAVQSDLRKTKRDVEDLHSTVSAKTSSRERAEEIGALRSEIAQLRKDVEHEQALSAERREASFPSRELDILTSSITKIGNRASQVETLQMELQILKGRVERMETTNKSVAESKGAKQSAIAMPAAPYTAHEIGRQDSAAAPPTRRKRSATGLETSHARDDIAALFSDISDASSQQGEKKTRRAMRSSPSATDAVVVANSQSAKRSRVTRGSSSARRTRGRGSRKSMP